jgi:hypothetical protein
MEFVMICQYPNVKLQNIAIIKPMAFSDWINQKYIEWRGTTRGTVTEFAEDYIGVKQSIMSQWMRPNGKKPNAKSIGILAQRYPEVYDILDLPRPRIDLETVFSKLPIAWRENFSKAFLEYNSELSRAGIDTNSPEAREIINQAFERHGIKITLTDGNS